MQGQGPGRVRRGISGDGKHLCDLRRQRPPEIKDYCYWIDLSPINGTIAPGQYLRVGGQSYRITAVGYEDMREALEVRFQN